MKKILEFYEAFKSKFSFSLPQEELSRVNQLKEQLSVCRYNFKNYTEKLEEFQKIINEYIDLLDTKKTSKLNESKNTSSTVIRLDKAKELKTLTKESLLPETGLQKIFDNLDKIDKKLKEIEQKRNKSYGFIPKLFNKVKLKKLDEKEKIRELVGSFNTAKSFLEKPRLENVHQSSPGLK